MSFFLKIKDRIKQSEYLLNASRLMTGSVLSQILPILVAPMLSRIYQPSDYGVLGLYMSITGMVSMVATLQYVNAIVMAKSEEEAMALMKWCLQLLGGFTLIAALLALALFPWIGNWFGSDSLSWWLLAAPVSIFMNGLSGIFANYAIRQKQFGLVSSNRVYGAVIGTLCSLTIGYLTRSPLGLFVGLWAGQSMNGLLFAGLSLKKSGRHWRDILSVPVGQVAKTYINFPKYSLPADFINNFTNQLPVFMLNTYGSVAVVGNYNMCNRILGLPSQFVSGAFGEVFRQKAAEDYNRTGNCRPVFMRTFKILAGTAILPFTLLMIWGPDLFAWVLGSKWRVAGEYAQIMGVLFLFRYVVSPLSFTVILSNNQIISLYMDIVLFILTFSSFYLGYVVYSSTYHSLLFFSCTYSLTYLFTFAISFKKTKKNE